MTTAQLSPQEWMAEYEIVLSTPPAPGTILTTIDGSDGRLELVAEAGKRPFIFARVSVPNRISEEMPAWYLHPLKNTKNIGWRCVLLTKARDEVIRRHGVANSVIPVKSLRVVKMSDSGRSLLCEVHEYADIAPSA